jgi:hypothetical protein
MKHILFQKAFYYKKRANIKPPDSYGYDHLLGAWVNLFDKSLLISSKKFPEIGTKKFDIETGEDHKSE